MYRWSSSIYFSATYLWFLLIFRKDLGSDGLAGMIPLGIPSFMMTNEELGRTGQSAVEEVDTSDRVPCTVKTAFR